VGMSLYTQWWRGGRVVECGGLENRYVGNPGVGGSNPPLSAFLGIRLGASARIWILMRVACRLLAD
jgi:hypothetical protein